MPVLNIKEAERCQELRLTRQFIDPFKPLSSKEYAKLKKSIEKVGQQKPVIMYANILVEGYHRLMALKELDIITIKVERITFTTVSEAVQWKINNHLNRKHERKN